MKKNNANLVVSEFNKKEQFELWNIKTSIQSILFNFYNTYQTNKEEINNGNEKILVSRCTLEDDSKEYGLSSSNKEQYFLTIDSVVMTPTNLVQKNYLVSKSAMRQYLDVLIAFKIIKPAKEIYYKDNMLTGFFSVNFKILKSKDFVSFLAQAFYNLRKNLIDVRTKARRIFYTSMVNFMTFDWDEEDEINCKYIDIKAELPTRIQVIHTIAKDGGLVEISNFFDTLGWTEKEIVEELLMMTTLYK